MSNLTLKFGAYQAITLKYVTDNGVDMNMYIEEPYLASKDHWSKLRDCITNDKRGKLVFCECNNFVGLEYVASTENAEGKIVYDVRTGGHGGDGRITVSFQKSEYGQTFVDIINQIIANDALWEQSDEE